MQCNVPQVTSGNRTCGEMFLENGIQGNYGDGEMGVNGFVRLSFVTRDSTFDLFMDKLSDMLQG